MNKNKLLINIAAALFTFCVVISFSSLFIFDTMISTQNVQVEVSKGQYKLIEDILNDQQDILSIVKEQIYQIDSLTRKVDSLEFKINEFDNELTEIFD